MMKKSFKKIFIVNLGFDITLTIFEISYNKQHEFKIPL